MASDGKPYSYDELLECVVCADRTPHNTNLIGGKAICLACGVVTSPENAGKFKRCVDCGEWLCQKQEKILSEVTGDIVDGRPLPLHMCPKKPE